MLLSHTAGFATCHCERIYGALLRHLLEDTWNPVEWEGFEAPPRQKR
jgi:hypothetical protein